VCATRQKKKALHACGYTIVSPSGCYKGSQTAEGERREGGIVDLQISIRESAGVTIVDLKGKATIGDDNDLLSSELRKLVANGVRNLLLNLAELTQVDSSSIGTIAATFVSLSRQGGSLKLLRPRDRVQTALGATRLLDHIPTFEDETQALVSFGPRGHSAGT
jgi:anti-sigma B factor antagonist